MVRNLVLLSLVVTIVGVVVYTTRTVPKYEGDIIKASIGVPKEPLSALAIIAHKAGLFREYGIDIAIKPYKGGKQSFVNGLLANKIDMAITADVPITFSAFKRRDFRIIATIASSGNEPRIVARKDKGVNNPVDLKSKNIVTKSASAVHFFLDTFLVHSKLSSSDINLTFTKSGSEMIKLLASGKVDAMSHREPFTSLAKKELGGNAVVFAKPGIYLKTFNLVINPVIQTKKPLLAKRVLKALIAAKAYSIKYPARSIKYVSDYIGIDSSSIQESWKSMSLHVALSHVLLVTLETQARWAIKNNLVSSKTMPPFLKLIDTTPLKVVYPDGVDIIEISAN